jgi:N-acetyl-anhydromuramoyl-L-alanine amidase
MPDEKSPELWHEGWFRGARKLSSPNCGPRPQGAHVDLVVIHSISLPPGEFGGNEVPDLFLNRLDWDRHPYFKRIEGLQVSAHFFVRRDGEILQFVSCDDRAWHAGASHYRGRDNCNDDSIGIELEGLEGQTFETEQYVALQTLCTALLTQYPIAHIAGHEHIAPGRKCDPGAGFAWDFLQQSLGLPSKCFPESTQKEA